MRYVLQILFATSFLRIHVCCYLHICAIQLQFHRTNNLHASNLKGCSTVAKTLVSIKVEFGLTSYRQCAVAHLPLYPYTSTQIIFIPYIL